MKANQLLNRLGESSDKTCDELTSILNQAPKGYQAENRNIKCIPRSQQIRDFKSKLYQYTIIFARDSKMDDALEHWYSDNLLKVFKNKASARLMHFEQEEDGSFYNCTIIIEAIFGGTALHQN